jgi:hypothetical protein
MLDRVYLSPTDKGLLDCLIYCEGSYVNEKDIELKLEKEFKTREILKNQVQVTFHKKGVRRAECRSVVGN